MEEMPQFVADVLAAIPVDGHEITINSGLGSKCVDCGGQTFCGVAHGAGHDHSQAAQKCTWNTRVADGTCPDCLGPLTDEAFQVPTKYKRCTRCGHVFLRSPR